MPPALPGRLRSLVACDPGGETPEIVSPVIFFEIIPQLAKHIHMAREI
jgi:hypothetical protein